MRGSGHLGVVVATALMVLGASTLMGMWSMRGVGAAGVASDRSADSSANEPNSGRVLWLRDCAVCHGAQGTGSSKAPSIAKSGAASVDFMVTTGRMPMEENSEHATRHPVRYTNDEVRELVAYATTLTSGPAIPTVSTSQAAIAPGGKLYREKCASCHQAAGEGGALAYGVNAPPLDEATPRQVVEALRTGPGPMPVFDSTSISKAQSNEIASYVEHLDRKGNDRGGANLAHLGPVPEGLVAWMVGLGALLIITRMLGTRSRFGESEHGEGGSS